MSTNRIGFSKWEHSDLELANSLWGDQCVTKFISATGIFTREQVKEKLLKEIKNDEVYHVQYWPIFENETNEHIGCCGLQPYNLEDRVYEIGFHLKRKYWGKGYAIEAADAVIEYAFKELKANNLFAGHNPKNIASQKMLQKLGFNYTHNELYPPTGLQHPSYLYKKND